MLSIERMEKIKEYMQSNKFVRLEELETMLGISRTTVRRCLLQLESENYLKMVRGGAVLASAGSVYEQPYHTKHEINKEEKQRIAKRASEFIKNDYGIFLDSSTTVAEMVPHLDKCPHLMVATNDLLISSRMRDFTNMTVTVLGGTLRYNFYTLTGMYAERMLGEMCFDYAFIGIDSISRQGGFMLTNIEEVQIKRLAAHASRKVVVLCDHSKFEKTSFINVCGFSDVDLIITGKELDEQIYREYLDLGPEIILV